MSIDTSSRAIATPSTLRAADAGLGVTFGRVLRSEWIKMRSVRSIMITLFGSAFAVVAIGVIAAISSRGTITPSGGGGQGIGSDSTAISLAGVQLAQLIVAIVGVLLVTSEYSTGTIRGTLAAVPKRWPVLLGKTVVFGAVTFVVELVAVLIAFFAGQIILGSKGVSLFDSGVLQAVIGAAIVLAGIGMLGVALGFLLRSTASGIAVVVVTFFLLPVLLGLFSAGVQADVKPYLPSSAATSLTSVSHMSGYLSYWPGLVVLLAYVAILTGGALTRMLRKDAN